MGVAFLAMLYFLAYRKGFYNYTHADFDLLRLPLVEPYEIYSVDIHSAENWTTSIFKTESMYDDFKGIGFNGPHVDSVGISGYHIFFYSSDENFDVKIQEEAWLVFNAETERGLHFTNRPMFMAYLKDSLRLDGVKLYKPQTVFKEFEKSRKLPPEWPKK